MEQMTIALREVNITGRRADFQSLALNIPKFTKKARCMCYRPAVGSGKIQKMRAV